MRWVFAVTAVAFVVVSLTAQEKKLQYPETKKGSQVDDYHGTKVADPYRWLEDDVRTSKDVAAWVEAENKVPAHVRAISTTGYESVRRGAAPLPAET